MSLKEILCVVILIIAVATIVVDQIVIRCGPGPWNLTRAQIVKLEMLLDDCRPLTNLHAKLLCVGELAAAGTFQTSRGSMLDDAYGTPLHFGPSKKCSKIPFREIYSSGPNRIDDCGSGDDIR
jgi:hypothetical protein